MKASVFHLKNRVLWRDRYALLGLCGFLMVSNLLLSVGLLLKKDRVILMPPQLKQPLWVEGNGASPSYLQEITTYFVHLIWDRTKENGIDSINMVLRYVDPQHYGAIRSRLIAEHERVQKDDIRTQCSITALKVRGLEVVAEGVLTTYVGRDHVSTRPIACRMVYGFSGGMVRLQSFLEEKKS